MKWVGYVAHIMYVTEEIHMKFFTGKLEGKEKVRSIDMCIKEIR
jgi:hypothetical protein